MEEITKLKAESFDILATIQQLQERLQQNNQKIVELSQKQEAPKKK